MMLIFILLIFVFMDAVLFAFGSAIQSINVTEFEKEMEGGDVKAGRVLRIYNRPEKFVNTIQTLEMAFAIAIGCVIIRNFFKDLDGCVGCHHFGHGDGEYRNGSSKAIGD